MNAFFSIEGVKKTVFGTGAINTIAEECRTLGAGKALVVMDRELSKTEICGKAMDLLKQARVKVVPYPEITPEPSPSLADQGAELAKQEKVASVIGIGGGSTLDVAKAIAVLAKNEGVATDFIGLGLVKKPGLPTIMIPTTAGTGSEVTFTAVFTMRETKTKGGINSPFLYPHTAIVDPLRLAGPLVPMLCLGGSDTAASTRRIATLLRQAFPLAQHVTLDSLGHMGPITHPAAVNARIADFLRALPEELDLDERLKAAA